MDCGGAPRRISALFCVESRLSLKSPLFRGRGPRMQERIGCLSCPSQGRVVSDATSYLRASRGNWGLCLIVTMVKGRFALGTFTADGNFIGRSCRPSMLSLLILSSLYAENTIHIKNLLWLCKAESFLMHGLPLASRLPRVISCSNTPLEARLTRSAKEEHGVREYWQARENLCCEHSRFVSPKASCVGLV